MNKKMNNIGRQELLVLRERLNEAIAPIAEEFGLTIKATNGTYGNSHGHFKVEIATTDTDGNEVTKESADYLSMCQWDSDWKPEWLFQNFTTGGKEYRVVGWSTRSSKYPLLACDVISGNRHKFTDRVRATIATAMLKGESQ